MLREQGVEQGGYHGRKLGSRNSNPYLLGVVLCDSDLALRHSTRSIEVQPHVNYFWFQRAQIHTMRRDYVRAAADYAEAIRVCPASEKAAAYGMHGGFGLSLSRIDPAFSDFTEAIRLQGNVSGPEIAGNYVSRGRVYLARDELDKAIANLDEAINRSPGSTYPHYDRATAWM